jgi:hypothetical protein
MRIIIFYLSLFLITGCLSAQTFELKSYAPTPAVFQALLLPNYKISANDTLNEQLVDLVIPMLADSTVRRKKQHHKIGPIGWFVSTFGGFNWRAISKQKEKFVGTVVRESRSGKEQFTEYDVNFDLNFHLKKYLFRVFAAYDRQGKIKRFDVTRKRQRNYKAAPFVRDTNDIDIKQYRLHCELTPERAYRGALNYLYYPTLPGAGGLKGHPNFEAEEPTVGFYGLFCLDCNHSCHPELHPYEWMWWLKARDGDSSTVKEWNLGIFHEASNRQKKWSKNPKIGQVRLPFAMKVDKAMRIEIEHGVMNRFWPEALSKWEIPAGHFNSGAAELDIKIEGKDFEKTIAVHFMNPIKTGGLKYWFDELNYDAETGILSGFLYYAVAAEDLYTCQIRFVN